MGEWCYMCERQLCLTALECICADTTKHSDFRNTLTERGKITEKLNETKKNKDLRIWSKCNQVKIV